MLTYTTEPPPLVADLSHTHAQYLPFKRSILRAERTKKSLVRNSRVLSVQVHDAHTQQVMTFTTEMCNKPLAQTYMFRLQKCRFSNAIVPLLHTNSAAITYQLTLTDFTLHFSCCFTNLLHSHFVPLLNNFTMQEKCY